MRLKWMALSGLGLLAAQVNAEETSILKTHKDKVSYAIGVDLARNFQRLGVEVDPDLLVKAWRDVFSGRKLILTEEELRGTINAYQTELRQRQVQDRRLAAHDNKKEGDDFLAENKKREGVVALPNGLQYKIIKEGDGRKPSDADTVEVYYRGTLINGTEFDSSQRGGQPATFKVTGVIPGWKEALKLMSVGSRWLIFIPPELAYGARGAGRDIGPNATLIFDLELLTIK